MELLELQGVSKVYRTGGIAVTALAPTDLVILRGEFVCLAGPSGSGKSTLLNLMGGIDQPSSGTVLLNGRPASQGSRSRTAAWRLHNLGFIFQSFNLIPVLTAYENVEYVLLLQGVEERARRERVEAAFASVGLSDHLHRRPAELSGGQQQRVAVARAIVGSPQLVLADEPTASLDSKTGADLLTLLLRLNQEQQITFVFSSHDPGIIGRAHRVLSLKDGVIGDDGK